MVKYNSKDLTISDIEKIDKHGADYVSKNYNIDYELAKKCETKLRNQSGGNDSYSGKRNLRQYRGDDNQSSDSFGMRSILDDSDSEMSQMSQVLGKPNGMINPYSNQGMIDPSAMMSPHGMMDPSAMMSPHGMMDPNAMMSPHANPMLASQNPYVHNFDLSNTQAVNVNPMTNQENPNLSLAGNPLQPITGDHVVNNIVNNPNPNIFNVNQPTGAGQLPPQNEQMDPLMINQMVPVVNAQQMLANLKQLNAI